MLSIFSARGEQWKITWMTWARFRYEQREIQSDRCSLLILRHCGSFLFVSFHSRALFACQFIYRQQFLDPRMFVYANALHAVISSRERWVLREAGNQRPILRIPCDRAMSDIGNPPARELPPETVRRRASIMHTRERSYEKVAFSRTTPRRNFLWKPRRGLLFLFR